MKHNSNNTSSLTKFLNNHYAANKELITHTRIKSKKSSGGSYYISEDDLDEFYTLYYENIFKNFKYDFITEVQLKVNCPILVDFDFKFDKQINSRQHTKDHILDMIELYLDTLKKIFKFNNQKFPLMIFQKPNINKTTSNDFNKDGIHMIIGIQLDHHHQVALRDLVLQELPDIWSDIQFQNDYKSILDEGISQGYTNWQLYGSRKPDNEAYQLTYYWDINFNVEDQEFEFTEKTIKTFNFEKNFNQLTARYNNYTKFDLTDEFIQKKMVIKQKKLKIKEKKIQSLDDLNNEVNEFLDSIDYHDYKLKETHNFVMALPSSYYEEGSYSKWIRVGWALKNTDKRMLLTWFAFSAQTKNFTIDMLDDLLERWNSFEVFNKEGLTYKSIMYWCKLENPEKYQEIHKTTIAYFIQETIQRPAETDLANVLYYLFKDRFICSSIKNNTWFEFISNKWEEIDSGTTLYSCISNDLRPLYRDRATENINAMYGLEENSEKWSKLQRETAKLSDIGLRLGKTNDKSNIMREAKHKFYDKNFTKNIDANPYLMAFNNGIIDFENKVFRDGLPEDYITMSTHIDYIPLDEVRDKTKIDEIKLFFTQLFPDKSLNKYVWEHLASILIGKNINQTFNIYTGSGRNGKSKMVELLAVVLGDYIETSAPLDLITGKRKQIGGTSSEVMQLKGIRYAVLNEPSKGDKINEGSMKELTGGDNVKARALFKEAETFKPQFKLVVCTNTLFDIKSNDEGTWRRIRICPFKSLFTESPNDSPDLYEFKVDKNIENKFESWKEVFMAMLVQIVFKTNGHIEDCEIVMERCKKYREDQDYLSQFVNSKIKEDKDGIIKKTEVYETFKAWYMENHGKYLPKGKELYDYIDNLQVANQRNKYKNGWKGISIIYDDENIEINLNE